MVFGLFKSDSSAVRDKIIYTQKQRIVKLEQEIENLRQDVDDRHHEIRGLREKHETAKERLVEQIVDLSDKFAANHSKILAMAEENARLKVALDLPKAKALSYAQPKTRVSAKPSTNKAATKTAKKSSRKKAVSSRKKKS